MKLDKELNIGRYKRFFAFGCSFTEYMWPTWADILGMITPMYQNYGICGLGNMGIFLNLVEANTRHKFNEDDLVIVKWTNVAREDRYVRGMWLAPGNIFSQHTYSDEWVAEFADERGYLIRDLGCISAARDILDKTGCSWDFTSMVPLLQINQYKSGDPSENVQDVVDLYQDTLDLIKPSDYEILYNFDYKTRENELFWSTWQGHGPFRDSHPTPLMHMEALRKTYYDFTPPDDVLAEITRIHENRRNIVTSYEDWSFRPTKGLPARL